MAVGPGLSSSRKASANEPEECKVELQVNEDRDEASCVAAIFDLLLAVDLLSTTTQRNARNCVNVSS